MGALLGNIVKKLKFSKYFQYRRRKSDRVQIKDEWIQSVINNPESEEIQSDGRIRKWGRIEQATNRYIRVVLLSDGVTVHNAFFDRSYRGKKK